MKNALFGWSSSTSRRPKQKLLKKPRKRFEKRKLLNQLFNKLINAIKSLIEWDDQTFIWFDLSNLMKHSFSNEIKFNRWKITLLDLRIKPNKLTELIFCFSCVRRIVKLENLVAVIDFHGNKSFINFEFHCEIYNFISRHYFHLSCFDLQAYRRLPSFCSCAILIR